jgi:hypothetical protein
MKGRKAMFLGAVVLLLLAALLSGCNKSEVASSGGEEQLQPATAEETQAAFGDKEIAGQAAGSIAYKVSSISGGDELCVPTNCRKCSDGLCCDKYCVPV